MRNSNHTVLIGPGRKKGLTILPEKDALPSKQLLVYTAESDSESHSLPLLHSREGNGRLPGVEPEIKHRMFFPSTISRHGGQHGLDVQQRFYKVLLQQLQPFLGDVNHQARKGNSL